MDQIRLDLQDKLPPTRRTRQQNTLPPQDKKVPPPRIISGTALSASGIAHSAPGHS